MVFYRKYRPQKISELDLESVRQRLTSILTAKEIPHAFLFTGPKGLGKTSSARILAKAINCEKKQLTSDKSQVTNSSQRSNVKGQISNIEPCNKCDSCVSITNGSNIDVIEIDAASNRGIDEIRDLREKVKFSPAAAFKKVYIIDEVHMLTNEAFNALLKTLEEPPDHVVFILATTEVEKVPPTILSRTFHIEFQKPSQEELLHSLNRIVSGEKLEVETGVLEQVYKLSEGSFRDAAKILEDLSFSSDGKKITLELLEKSYKSESLEAGASNLLSALSAKKLDQSLGIIEELSQKGVDFKILMEKLAQLLHGAILASAGVEKYSSHDKFKFEGPKQMQELLDSINESYKNIKFAVMPQIPLELVVVGWCLDEAPEDGKRTTEDRVQKGEIESKNTEDGGLKTEDREFDQRTENGGRKTEDGRQRTEDRKLVTDSAGQKTEEEPTPKPQLPTANPHGDLFMPNAKPDNFFAALISSIKQDNHSIAGILRGCRLVSIEGGQVVFETRFKFHRDRLSDSKTITILEKRAGEILREQVRVVVNLVGQTV